MSPAGTFVEPIPFPTPVVAPRATTLGRTLPYVSTSEYTAAPTGVKVSTLIPGATPEQIAVQLASEILRASDWINLKCFHRPQTTMVASVTTDNDWVRVLPDGTVPLICNIKPVIEVIGIAVGGDPYNVASIDPSAATVVSITDERMIWLPGGWSAGAPVPLFGNFANTRGQMYAVWSFVAGWPHFALANPATAGATSIDIVNPDPGAPWPHAVYPGTQLEIRDYTTAGLSETVTVATSPTSNTLELADPLQSDHTPPGAPDNIFVSALPWAIEQATIDIVSVFIKSQGSRAMVLPSTPATPVQRKALSLAGCLEDFDRACHLLKSFKLPFIR
jgi:hypothetical protein